MEVIKLQVAEYLKEKQHVWCEGNMKGRSYSSRDKEAHLYKKEEMQENTANFSPKFISKLFLLKKLLRVSQCKETAISVKQGRYTDITYVYILI